MSSDTPNPGSAPDRVAAIEGILAALSRPASQADRHGKRDLAKSGVQQVLPIDPRRRTVPGARIASFVLVACVVSLVALAFEPAVTEPLPGAGPAPALSSLAGRPDTILPVADTAPAPTARGSVPLPPPVVKLPSPPRSAPPRHHSPPPRAVPRPIPRFVPPPPPGYLFVSSFPWGHLYLDGVSIGDTPQSSIPVSPGTHRILITRPGYRALERTITVAPAENVRLAGLALEDAT